MMVRGPVGPWDPHEPTKRVQGESKNANRAFLDYLRLGPGRSIKALHEYYVEVVSKKEVAPGMFELPPTRSSKTLCGWSKTFHWQDRLNAWEEMEQAKRQEKFEKEREEWRDKRKLMAQGVYDRLAVVLNTMDRNNLEAGGYTLDKAVGMMKVVLDVIRQEWQDDVQQVDVTTGGKPLAIKEIVVERPRNTPQSVED